MAFPEEVRVVVEQFDSSRNTTTLLRTRLAAGKSGAFVALVDCEGENDGIFVLKVDTAKRGTKETLNHRRALSLGAFHGKIPELVATFEVADANLLLLKIAGGSRITWRPLAEALKLFASGYVAMIDALWDPTRLAFGTQTNAATFVADSLVS